MSALQRSRVNGAAGLRLRQAVSVTFRQDARKVKVHHHARLGYLLDFEAVSSAPSLGRSVLFQ